MQKYILIWRKRQTGRKWIKYCVRFLLLGLILLLGTILLCNRIIIHSTESCLYDQVETIPENRVGVLLGTSPKLRGWSAESLFQLPDHGCCGTLSGR